MVARLFVGAALIVLGAGFLWFAGNIIYLGIKEFFKPKTGKKSSSIKQNKHKQKYKQTKQTKQTNIKET